MSLDADQLVGQTIGKFRFEALVGEGGMAFVYRGVHVDLGQHVAIKVLFPEFCRRKSIRARFKREARLQFQLQHPNIVRVIDFIDEGKVLGMVLDWVDGGDLSGYLGKQKEPVSLPEVRRLFLPILDAMSHAHEKGIIHRDLKPHNIMLHGVSGSEAPKVMDFGIAWSLEDDGFHTKTGVVIGTPFYISPEQATASKKIDHRTDIYALGITLFQMLTGHLPFVGDSAVEVISAHCFNPVPMMRDICPSLPPVLDGVVQKALAKHPDERFSNCAAFFEALSDALPEGFPNSVMSQGAFRHERGIELTSAEDFLSAKEKETKSSPEEKEAEQKPVSFRTRAASEVGIGLGSSPPLPSVDDLDAVPHASSVFLTSERSRTIQFNWRPWLFMLLGVLVLSFLLLFFSQKSQKKMIATKKSGMAVHQVIPNEPQRRRLNQPVPEKRRPIIPVVRSGQQKPAERRMLHRDPPKQRSRRPRLRPKRPHFRSKRMGSRVTVRKRLFHFGVCRICVKKAFQRRQAQALMGHNPHAMDGGGCNYIDFSRVGKTCRYSCGRSFYHYCRAYLHQKTGRCQKLVTMSGLLRSLKKSFGDARIQTSRRCLKDWQ